MVELVNTMPDRPGRFSPVSLGIIGLVVVLIGIGFIAAYHGLRDSPTAVTAPIDVGEGAAELEDPLSGLDAEAEESGLSPEARAAVLRAQRRVQERQAEEAAAQGAATEAGEPQAATLPSGAEQP